MRPNLPLIVFLLLTSCWLTQIQAQPEVTPAMQSALADKTNDAFISVNLRLSSQLDEKLLYQQSRTFNDRDQRRAFVVNELKQFSMEHQTELLSFLKEMEAAGMVKDIRPLWIGNLVNCMAKPGVINQLMIRKDLARIDYNKERKVMLAQENRMNDPVLEPDKLQTRNLAWNVTMINANQVWAEGYTGEGVIVAVMDTGVNYNHNDIKDNMWEHPDYPNHGFNFVNNNHVTMDDGGHGTHCAGTVAGNGASGTVTGIAPDATIMNLKVLGGSGSGTEAGVWAAIEFAVEYGAHVMSLSLGWQHQWSPDRSMWRTTMNNALSAGVIAAVAAGNEGGWGGQPPPSEVRTPGDVPPPWTHPDQTQPGGNSAVVSVGATDSNDNLASFSSKGPVTWQNISPFNDYAYNPGIGLIRPDVSAPGVNIVSLIHSNNTGYTTMSGTSMATPAVAGVMALMISKDPNILPEDISRILEETAVPKTTSKSNTFGSGRVDALAAVTEVVAGGVRYLSHQVDDSQGNNDGNINPGEQILLDITFENPGEEAVNNVTAQLDVLSPYITLTGNTANLGNFSPGQAKNFTGVFAFEASDNIPGNHEIEFTVTTYAAADPEETWTSSFTEIAHAPFIEFSQFFMTYPDTGLEADVLNPGETVNIHLQVINTGNLQSGNTISRMSAQSPYLTILSDEMEHGVIPAGSHSNAVFTVEAHEATAEGTLVDLLFEAIDGAHYFESTQPLVIGQVPEMTIGEGTDQSNQYPFYNYYRANRSQMIYLQSELGAGQKTIEEIAYEIINASTSHNELPNFEIRMVHTTATTLSGFVATSDGDVVYSSNPHTMPLSPGWHNWELDTPFEYNGINNLLVEVVWGRLPNWTTNWYKVASTNVGANRVAYGYSDWVNIPGYSGNSAIRPNILLAFTSDEIGEEQKLDFVVRDNMDNLLGDAGITIGSLTRFSNVHGQVSFDLMPGNYHFIAEKESYVPVAELVNLENDAEVTVVLMQDAIMPGDANGDGVVDILDVVTIVQYFAGNDPEPFYFHNADSNQDGIIDLLDVIATLNLFTQGKATPHQGMESDSADMYLLHDGISLRSDGTLAGLQFEVAPGTDLPDMQLDIPGFQLVHLQDGEIMRTMLFSPDNTPVPAGNIRLISLDLQGLSAGPYMLRVDYREDYFIKKIMTQ